MFRRMPGVAWLAVGESGSGFRELLVTGSALARRYLRRGDGFVVKPEATGRTLASDLGGAMTSAILEAVKGSRVREDKPKVMFRAALDGTVGAVGVEISEGPVGTASGRDEASCLVSGGRHSSVVAWMSLLSGLRVKLVHAKSDDASLLAVAKLYSELSHRVDPSFLSLEVIDSRSPASALSAWSRKGGVAFGGFHAGCSSIPRSLGRKVGGPLLVLSEEKFLEEYADLSLKEYASKMDWAERRPVRVRTLAFGGKRADVSDVLDGLKPQRTPGSARPRPSR